MFKPHASTALAMALTASLLWPVAHFIVAASPAAASERLGGAGDLAILNKQGVPTALCPLKHTDVKADITGFGARVTVKQQFENPSNEVIEAIYTFPMPEDAAVDDMTMVIGNRVIKGQIKKRDEARAIYDAARAQGQAAALLDQERPNIFTQSVANIMPRTKVEITISYVQVLKYEEGSYAFTFPMVVGPRYVAGGGHQTPGQRGVDAPAASLAPQSGTNAVVNDGAKISPPIAPKGVRAGHDISVSVNLDAGVALEGISAQLHEVDVRRVDQQRAVVTLKDQNQIPNKDFVLRFKTAGGQIKEGLIAYARMNPGVAGRAGNVSPVSGYFTLIVQPPAAPQPAEIAPKEMVFVIDQTGSQSGWPIAKAKETMKYCIQKMNRNDTFQLIGFNTQVFPCFSAPVHNTPENVAKALKFLAPIEGNGGTDILKSVDYALNIPDDPERLRIVCYLTDGYVGNDMQIIDYIQKHRGRARMFPFGMGNSVNRFLIEGMAREGKGAADYVFLNDDGQKAAERFYKRIASPLLADVKVTFGGLPVTDVFPKVLPDLFSSSPIILKGRYTAGATGEITVSGLVRGKSWTRIIPVSLPQVRTDTSAIPTLWAREKIEDLQNQDWLGTQNGKPDPTIQNQIIATALEYRLMSQFTSFVAVEERVVNVGGRQRTMDIPVEMPDGVAHEGIFGGADSLAEQEVAFESLKYEATPGRAKRRSLSTLSDIAAGSQGQQQANRYYFRAASGSVALPQALSRVASGGSMGGYGGGQGFSQGIGGGGGRGLGRGGVQAPGGPPAALGLQIAPAGGTKPTVLSASPATNLGSVTTGKSDAKARSTSDWSVKLAKEKSPVRFSDSDGRVDRLHAESKSLDLYTIADGESRKKSQRDQSKKAEPKQTPEMKRTALRQFKLTPGLYAKVTKPGFSHGAPITLNLWLNEAPPAVIAKLMALGVRVDATLIKGRVLLVTVPAAKIDALLELSWIIRMDEPKFKL